MDEPTAMLDPNGRKEVLNTVHRLNRQKGVTVILITHYMDCLLYTSHANLNDLAAGGAEPVGLMLTALLPPEIEEAQMRQMVQMLSLIHI